MATSNSLLPLAVIHNNQIYRNLIIRINGKAIALIPFEQECEATRFISSFIIVSNPKIEKYIDNLPSITDGYKNIDQLITFLSNNDLFAHNDEEPTLISASPSGYKIL